MVNKNGDYDLLVIEGMQVLNKKNNSDTSNTAKASFEEGNKSSNLKILFYPLIKFLQYYLFNAFVFKGIKGFILSMQKSYSCFLHHAKLYEYQNKKALRLKELPSPDMTATAANLSVYMVAQDEKQTIAEALKRAEWAAEIVVVDSGSQDNTVEIAKEVGAKVSFKPMARISSSKAICTGTMHK